MKIFFYNRSYNGGVGYIQTNLGQQHFYSTAWQQFTFETEKAQTAGYHNIIFKLYQPGGSFYIDDVKIEIIKDSGGELMHAADYYPFGLAMAGNIKDSYRFGYQGEYAEDETEETGWNSFEARMYDPVIGRWLSVDPARQFASPYVGMGNEPVSGVDPDGRYSKIGASYRRFTALLLGYNPSKIYKSGEEWGYNLEVQNGAGAIFVYGKIESEFLNNNDNYHYWWRKFIPDVYYVEVGFDLAFIGGGGAEFGLALPTRGTNAGTLYGYRTFKFPVGLHGGAGLDFGRGDFSGEVEDFNFEEYFNGRAGKLEADYIIGLAIEQSDRIHGNVLTLTGLGIGPGIGAASAGGNTAATPFIGLW